MRKKLKAVLNALPDEALEEIYWTAIVVREDFEYRANLQQKGIVIEEIEDDLARKEVAQKWENTFAMISDEMKDAIYYDSYKWHLYSYQKVPHLTGEQAKEAFDRLGKKDIYFMYQGSSYVEIFKNACNLLAVDIKSQEDIYLFDETFSWTYVQTHEEDLGPYFTMVEKGE